MENIKKDNIERVLGIYTKIMNGYLTNKAEESANYGVNERSIQRDINNIRNYLEADDERVGCINSVVYDRSVGGYRLEQIYKMKLSNSEVLALCKILLDSRAFTKKEMMRILDKLISYCVPKVDQKLVTNLISNEAFHYVEPQHKTKFIDMMWDIGQVIREYRYIEINYIRMKDKATVKRKLKPLAIMFSEYYFYLIAFIDDESVRKGFDIINDPFPTIYRIDRIRSMRTLDEKFHIPYSNRFEEGEFRKRIQFHVWWQIAESEI